MLGLAAAPLGYRFACYGPEADSPAGQVAELDSVAAYDDRAAVRTFVQQVDVVTFEFENVPAHVAEIAARAGVPVRPAGRVLHTTQQRLREKEFLHRHNLPVAPFAAVHSLADLHTALDLIGTPAILKTADFGYDGKGQVRIDAPAQAEAAWDAIGRKDAVLEQLIVFTHEISVVAARGIDGAFAHYGALENQHVNHILDVTVAPARIAPATAWLAIESARTVLAALDVVGILCVEFFVLADGGVVINELAPRPHNSGHLTIEAAVTSQFEQQARAVCGVALGDTTLRPAAMVNLLGDLWQNGEPAWGAVLAMPNVHLHLYGKRTARPGRKMGHLTAVADTPDAAEAIVRAARVALGSHGGDHVPTRTPARLTPARRSEFCNRWR